MNNQPVISIQRRSRLLWRLATPFLLVLLAGLVALAVLAWQRIEHSAIERRAHSMRESLVLSSPGLLRALSAAEQNPDQLRTCVAAIAETIHATVTLATADGTWVRSGPINATESGVGIPGDHLPIGLQGTVVSGRMRIPRVAGESIVVCLPLHDADRRVVAAIEAVSPVHEAESPYNMVAQSIVWLVLVALAGISVALWLVWRLLHPLAEIRRGVERLANGDLTTRLRLPGTDELHNLVSAINHMAAQLDERLQALARQHNQQQAVFASMEEGVIAVDHHERVISINAAAATLGEVSAPAPEGRAYYEVLHHAALQRFVADTLASTESVEQDISLIGGNNTRQMRCHGTVLRDTDGQNIGAVIVLHDITRLRQLEDMRREFVGNVSHELRTPVTSIKGSAETLLDGAINSPQTAQRFLGIIVRHADRLSAIIEDLLSLSRLEQEGQENLRRERVPLARVLRNVADLCQPRCKGHIIKVECPRELELEAAPHLIEQAVLNLVDNAIKYSPAGGTIVMRGELEDDQVAVSVVDQGPGIPPEHLPRLFERFYRVDKGRSRLVGGTGLGLAIVKHIVQAHGGRVQADSNVGTGSTFIIRLPHVRRHTAVNGSV